MWIKIKVGCYEKLSEPCKISKEESWQHTAVCWRWGLFCVNWSVLKCRAAQCCFCLSQSPPPLYLFSSFISFHKGAYTDHALNLIGMAVFQNVEQLLRSKPKGVIQKAVALGQAPDARALETETRERWVWLDCKVSFSLS